MAKTIRRNGNGYSIEGQSKVLSSSWDAVEYLRIQKKKAQKLKDTWDFACEVIPNEIQDIAGTACFI